MSARSVFSGRAYRRAEPDGVDFALGRLGAYLLDRERVDEAAGALDEAIAGGTDIPAIWGDYLGIMTRHRAPHPNRRGQQPRQARPPDQAADPTQPWLEDERSHTRNPHKTPPAHQLADTKRKDNTEHTFVTSTPAHTPADARAVA